MKLITQRANNCVRYGLLGSVLNKKGQLESWLFSSFSRLIKTHTSSVSLVGIGEPGTRFPIQPSQIPCGPRTGWPDQIPYGFSMGWPSQILQGLHMGWPMQIPHGPQAGYAIKISVQVHKNHTKITGLGPDMGSHIWDQIFLPQGCLMHIYRGCVFMPYSCFLLCVVDIFITITIFSLF